jgi:hypothetical protein
MKSYVAGLFVLLIGCGRDKPPPKPVDPVGTATASTAPVASTAPTTTEAPDAGPPPAPAPKGTINTFAKSANSGKVDKVGAKDGEFKADGVKDTVFDLEYEGAAATGVFVMSVDKEGTLTSEYDADTMTGEQKIPQEIAGVLNHGKHTAGLAVFEGDKLLNGKDGGVALTEGKHKLALHISAKDLPKTAFRAFVLLGDGSLVKSAIIPK